MALSEKARNRLFIATTDKDVGEEISDAVDDLTSKVSVLEAASTVVLASGRFDGDQWQTADLVGCTAVAEDGNPYWIDVTLTDPAPGVAHFVVIPNSNLVNATTHVLNIPIIWNVYETTANAVWRISALQSPLNHASDWINSSNLTVRWVILDGPL